MDSVPVPRLRRTLVRHPATAGPTVTSVRAEVFRERDQLTVAFEFAGALEHLELPGETLDPARLWEHTCAELFVAGEDGRYVEWNFSPTGQAARFEFSAYRVRASASFDDGVTTSIVRRTDAVQVVATGPLLRDMHSICRASLSAVVRAPGGTCSYWALEHPTDEPEFHDIRGFVLDGGLLDG